MPEAWARESIFDLVVQRGRRENIGPRLIVNFSQGVDVSNAARILLAQPRKVSGVQLRLDQAIHHLRIVVVGAGIIAQSLRFLGRLRFRFGFGENFVR